MLVVGLLLSIPGPAAAQDPAHRRLAEHWAPVVFQESRSEVLDFITRFDYDGDWAGDNNWQNAYLFEQPGYAYYSVVESTSHYIVTYAFYHARDYTAQPFEGFAPKIEHENDMEGCTLVIEKDGTEFGTVVLLETLAHDVFYKYDNPRARRLATGPASMDGSMELLDGRPAVYIEPEGHGVKAAGPELTQTFTPFPGVIYRYTGEAAVPRSGRDPDATYDLLSIEDTLWARRFDVGTLFCCADPFVMSDGTTSNLGSAFNGPIGGCAAKPPWGWDQDGDAIAKGDLFRDPLRALSGQFPGENFGSAYIYNPFLQADGRSAGLACSESATSRTVRGAVGSSLLGIAEALTAGGLSRGEIGAQARQLFATDTVLLEWSRRGEFEAWNWDQTLSALPAIISDGLRDEMRIPLAGGFSFESPEFQAPARYFDSVVLNYRSPGQDVSVRVSWVYEDETGFSDERSVLAPLPRSDVQAIVRIGLADSPAWDTGRTLQRIRVSTEPSVGTVDAPAAVSIEQEPFVLRSLVFDRNAFSDTFER